MYMRNAPPQPTSFVGRETDIADVLRLLAAPSCRLLTLVGPGGSGKTRLALAVANACVQEAFFVPLQSITTADLLVTTIADVLKIPLSGSGTPQQQLFDYLHDKTLLLVLDNFEQLLESGGALVLVDLLAAAHNIKLLTTSHEALNIQEEWLYPVHGLPYPTDDTDDDLMKYSAVQLFVERAPHAPRFFAGR